MAIIFAILVIGLAIAAVLLRVVIVARAPEMRLAAGALLALGVCLAVYAFWIEPRRLTVARLTLPVAGLAAPVRVVAIGDPQPNALHWPRERLRAAFDRARAEQPDLVLWLGDYAYEPGGLFRLLGLDEAAFVEPADVIAEMARVTAPMGAYAVLGNHDWWWNGREVRRLLAQTPIHALLDQAALARHPETGAALWIVGLEDVATPRRTDVAAAMAQTDATAPVVALSHSPDAFPLLGAPGVRRPTLTLSGHTHGGQVWLPLLGRLLLPVRRREYGYGFFEEPDGRRLYVTSGIGTAMLPVRFMTPPEIVVIELTPE